jgi:hypothetical protein
MNKKQKKKFLKALQTIEDLKDQVPETWNVKVGEIVLAAYQNRYMIVDGVKLVFYAHGGASFAAEGRLLDNDGNPLECTYGFFKETVEDGWWKE